MRTLGLSGVTLCVALGVSVPTTAWADGTALALTSLREAAEPETPQPTSSKAPASTTVAPTPQPTSSKAPASTVSPTPEPTPAETPQPTSSKAPPSDLQPTSSKAPPSTALPEETVEEEPIEEPEEVEEPEEEITLEDSRRKAARDEAFHRHGLGFHGGINIIPTWLLSSWLATHTNALCRGTIGSFAEARGLTNMEGCNFYAGGDYIYRFSRVLDVAASVQYQRAKVPDGLWLDKSRYDGSAGIIDAADYTEVDLGLIALEVDFIARAPIVVTKDVEFGIGGGGGLGLGIVFGGVYQTPLGIDPSGYSSSGGSTPGTCETLEDLADLTRCTPRWDQSQAGDLPPPDQNDLSDPNVELFANCTATECNESDLQAFGYRRQQGGIPPVIPVVNLILSARVLIKDVVGITINGGWNTGFYFGGGLQFFFGKAEQDEMGKAPTMSKRKPARAPAIRF